MKLKGKTAVVTGGATGIGESIARSLAAEGCQVVLAGRREEKLHEAAAAWPGEPPLLTKTTDVADRQSVEQLFAWVEERIGRTDILVNAAGINVTNRSLAATLPGEWDRVLAVNATGTFNCMQAVLPSMAECGDGVIVNISSVAALRADTMSGVAYIASKFAMSALGTAAALEYGKQGIRVTNICPGDVDTPLMDGRAVPPDEDQRRRMLKAEDVAAAVLMVICLPPHAHIPELIIKPTVEDFA